MAHRNDEHGGALDSALKDTGLTSNLETTVHVARWAYTQTAQLGGLVWQEKQTLVPLEAEWENLLG